MRMSDSLQVLVTGASGVVGSALHTVVGEREVRLLPLQHRTPVEGLEAVVGDLLAIRLGMSDSAYRELVARVDVVLHAAAITDFGAGAGRTDGLNVEGTKRVLDLAAEAGARVLYTSSAFVE